MIGTKNVALATVFSITDLSNQKLATSSIQLEIVPIFERDNTIRSAGLVYNTNQGSGGTFKFVAPARTVMKEYVSSTTPSTSARSTVKAEPFYVSLKNTVSDRYQFETLDNSIDEKATGFYSAAIASLASAVNDELDVAYFKEVYTQLDAFPAGAQRNKHQLVLPTGWNSTTVAPSTGTAVTLINRLESLVNSFLTTRTSIRKKLPRDKIRIFVSQTFYSAYKNALGVLGRRPEYLESAYGIDGSVLSVNGVPLIATDILGQNNPTSGSTSLSAMTGVNCTNIHAVVVNMDAIKVVQGNVEIWTHRDPDSNNIVNGIKAAYGIKTWFNDDIYGLVTTQF